MNIYLGLTLEQAPTWLFEKYPDVRMIGRNGVPVIYETAYTLPSDGKPGPCFYNPVARDRQAKYITAIVKALGKYRNIVIWNTWQEIAHWAEGVVGSQIDYNPYTIAVFRSWLKSKYANISALNNSWKTNYGAWEQVGPPRQNPLGTGQDVDWRYFIDDVYVSDILKMRCAAIKAADPYHRPVFAHKNVPAIGSGMDWNYARCQDFMGSSNYPAWGPFNAWDDDAVSRHPVDYYSTAFNEMWSGLSLNFDYIRSANPKGNPVWAAEFQGGPISSGFQKGRIPSADDIRRWMLTVVGSGATTISYWVTRAEMMAGEDNGFGLLNSEGETTPRLEEASRVGKALMKYSDIFGTPSKPLAKVGIIVNEENYNFTSSYFKTSQHLAYSMRGWYRMLWDLGIPIDFVSIDELNENTAAQYKALILPFPLSLADTSAQRLEKYVLSGGNLISEAAIGRINENGISVRGEMSPRMRKLLGINQKSFTMVNEAGEDKRWMPQERGFGEFLPAAKLQGTGLMKGTSIRANFYLQTFDPGTAEPVLQYGNEVAGTVRTAGKGRAWIIGSFVGHNGTAYRDDDALAFVKKLMDNCGVEGESKGKLLLRRRIGANREAWLLTNPTPNEVTEPIDVSGWTKVTGLLDTFPEKNGDKISVTVPSLDVKVLIMEK
ncbi:MAG: beta-galactosidase [Chitinophagaceae bacterium]|nr:beta-galactosidase [Chitinophagaceae bacterium]